MIDKTPKRPRDVSQLAKMMVDIASKELSSGDILQDSPATAFGKQGGIARSQSLTSEQRSEIAKIAAKKRWEKP